jgi:5-methylcytosine-specific restriction endonuclease McrA
VERNRTKCCEAVKRWQQKNRDKHLEYNRAFHKANRERDQQKQNARYKAKPEQHQANVRRYRDANLEAVQARETKYRKENIEKVRERNRRNGPNQRARRKGAPGRHTAADIARLFDEQMGICAACKVAITKTGKGKYHVDHVMPLRRGGSNYPSNLQLLCPTCNRRKGFKHPDEWAKLLKSPSS